MLRTRIPDRDLILWNKKIIKSAVDIGYRNGEAMGYVNIANRYLFEGDTQKSLEYLDKASDISKGSEDDFLSGKLYQEYSQIYHKMNLSSLALDYSSKAMHYALKLRKDNRDCRLFLRYVYSTRAVSMHAVNRPDSALIYLHKAIKIEPNPLDMANTGKHHIFYTKKPDSAEYYFRKAFDLLKTKNFKHNKYQRAVVLRSYGLFLQSQKKNNEAIIALKQSIELAKQVKRPVLMLESYKELSALYKEAGNPNKENEYLKKANSLKDSLDNNETQAIDLSITKLNEEKEKIQLETKSNIALWYGGISLLLIIALTIYFYLRIIKKRKKLAESNKIIIEIEKETKKLRKKLSENYDSIIQLARENNIDFFPKFQETYPELCNELLKINPNLSKSDLSFCAMIWLGFSSKEIAQSTSMEHRSVQTKKYRIRKKLNLESEVDLHHFFRSLSDT
ncbi:LuxR C-terminal-related transcriptional regulator [Chryseobacterium sp. DT-3]|uniref:LuxR C-terminal-related transcriptional regulator n=1 Tax=Chryseobacterium sp. DT-3 TaxID=3396164 RepID=UPI003F19B5AE